MVQVKRAFYMPHYTGFLSCCGEKVQIEIKDKYPAGAVRISCAPCKKSYNLKFRPNDLGVMTMEIRDIGI